MKYLKPVYTAAGITGGLCLLFALFGGGLMSFSAPAEPYPNPVLLEAIRADRQQLLTSDAWRSFMFIALSMVVLVAYLKNSLKVKYLLLTTGILIFIDLWVVDRRVLNEDNFVTKRQAVEVMPTPADQLILQYFQ